VIVAQYTVRILSPERMRQAFSLIQAVHPRLSLEAWRRYARPRAKWPDTSALTARRGIFSLESQQGYILALFTFRVDADLVRGFVLQCDYLAAVDLLNPDQALKALVAAFCERARLTGCHAIRVATPRRLNALGVALAEHGFDRDWVDYGLIMEPAWRTAAARR
jgi:hypothetical protein